MPAFIQTRHKDDNAARAVLPMTAENLITAARIIPEIYSEISLYRDGGRFQIATLRTLGERDRRQLATGNHALAREIVAAAEAEIARIERPRNPTWDWQAA